MKTKYVLFIFVIVASASCFSQVSEKEIFRNGDLEISFVKSFTPIWTDKGSGASLNGGFFRPILTDFPNFYSLGDLAVRAHNANGQVIAVVRDVSDSGNILVAPLSYTKVWDDAGSGADKDGSVWRANPPAGYVAMGLVASGNHSAPSLNAMRCIKAEYVIKGKVSATVIWNDVGSGASKNFSAWGIEAPMVSRDSAGTALIYLSANTFVGHGSHNKPTDAIANLYTLILPIKEELPSDTVFPKLPILTSFNQPPTYSDFGTVSTTYLPWFSVKDAQLTMLQKIDQSPTYRMVRETRYKRINFTHNQGAETVTMNWSTSFGTSKSTTLSYSETTGIEMTVGFSGYGVNASITLSKNFTHTQENTTQWTQETTTSIDVPVPVNTATAAYLLESTYKLYRDDGTLVGSQLDHIPNGSFYITSFPKATLNLGNSSPNQFKIYPIPVNLGENIHLECPSSNIYQLEIKDLTGKVVYNVADVQNDISINSNHLEKGMYIITLTNANERFERKISVF
ncbi:MAG: Vps62-related protein [Bacteroidota bacterium]|nr:Vps62-related protein [Bacteroidota bacterium]